MAQQPSDVHTLGTDGSLVIFEDVPLLYKEETQITERLSKIQED